MGFITFPRTVLDKAFTYVKLEICLDEDWSDSFFLTEGERPIDLTGTRLELYCKPTFAHATTIKKLTTNPAEGATIFNEEPTKGAAYIFMFQAAVAAAFVPGRWQHFLRLVEDGESAQPLVREMWRGDLIVHAGKI
jgi:hypothetical protein